MQHAAFVRVVERRGDGGKHREGAPHGDRPAELVGESAPFEELGDDVGLVFELTVVVDGRDAGMTELGDRYRLTAKALAKLDVLGQKLGEDLDRNVALERRLIGLEQ